jgi:hypothetical protein
MLCIHVAKRFSRDEAYCQALGDGRSGKRLSHAVDWQAKRHERDSFNSSITTVYMEFGINHM